MSDGTPHFPQSTTRREFLLKGGGGFGGIALANLLFRDGALASTQGAKSAANPLAPRPSHFAPRAKRVIHLFMHGGPSHMDLWDPKPDLAKYAGKPLPD